MLNDGTGFKKVYIAAGFTDLRRGIDGLARIIRFQFQLEPYDKNTLFLFCGKRTDRMKGLLWEGDGFLLLYKRIENGNFRWPRSTAEAFCPLQRTFIIHRQNDEGNRMCRWYLSAVSAIMGLRK